MIAGIARARSIFGTNANASQIRKARRAALKAVAQSLSKLVGFPRPWVDCERDSEAGFVMV